jgi:hypothetical protein
VGAHPGPRRDEDDWSIAWTGCGCGHCDTLGAFLGSRSRRVFERPLATDGRRHVDPQIDSAGLPLNLPNHRSRKPPAGGQPDPVGEQVQNEPHAGGNLPHGAPHEKIRGAIAASTTAAPTPVRTRHSGAYDGVAYDGRPGTEAA